MARGVGVKRSDLLLMLWLPIAAFAGFGMTTFAMALLAAIAQPHP